jgi:anti-sigma factor RsiW
VIAPGGAHLGAQVSALLDGQLAPDQEDRAWRHVADCDACRAAVHREQWVKRRLSGWARCEPPDAPPLGLRAALTSLPAGPAIHGRRPEPARRGVGARLTVAAIGVGSLSAAFVVLGAGYLAESTSGTDDPPARTGMLPGGAVVADLSTGLPVAAPRPSTHRGRQPWATMEP